MRRWLFSVATLFTAWFSLTALGAPPTPANAPEIPAARPAEPQAASAKVDAIDSSPAVRMGLVLREVNLTQRPARSALEWWSATTGIAVAIDWDALEAEGVFPQQEVSLTLKNVTAEQALSLLLMQASNAQATLMFELSPRKVVIITKRMANRRPQTQVYDVSGLLVPPADFSQTDVRLSGDASLNNSVQRSDSSRKSPQERAQDLAAAKDKFIQDIQTFIEPEYWTQPLDQPGSLQFIDQKLIVTAPRYVQRQIQEYLGVPPIYVKPRPSVLSPAQTK